MTCNNISNKSSQMSLPWVFTRIIIILIIPRHWQTNICYHFCTWLLPLYIHCIYLSVPFSSGWLVTSWLLFSTSMIIGGSAPLTRNVTVVSSFWDMIVKTWNMAQATYSLTNTWLAMIKIMRSVKENLCWTLYVHENCPKKIYH